MSKNNQEVENYTYDNNSNRLQATINGITTTASYTLDDNLEVLRLTTPTDYLFEYNGVNKQTSMTSLFSGSQVSRL